MGISSTMEASTLPSPSNRPCTCERVTGAPYTSDQCRLCWLFHYNPAYRQLWTEPTFLDKVGRFVQAAAQHVLQGAPLVSEAVFQQRMATCQSCGFYNKGGCKLCGCNLHQKARWATQDCPLCIHCGRPSWDHDPDCLFCSRWNQQAVQNLDQEADG
jgi:hypothetical protein